MSENDSTVDTDVDTTVDPEQSDAEQSDAEGNVDNPEPEPDTFPREYVTRLRDENARYRQRAQRADELARRLHVELVRATGRLADPEDLPFADTHVDDPEALGAALDELLERKPHLASRRPFGDVGQGAVAEADTVSLAGILRARAS